jgi:hypothetical protein
MKRHRRALITSLSFALLMLAVTAVLVAAAPGRMTTIGIIPSAHQPGLPAIRPTQPGTVPSFTAQDAIDYVNQHGTLWTTPGQVKVTAVQYMTAAESIKVSHGSLQDSDVNRPVYLVTVRGTYQIYGPPDDQGHSHAGTFSGAYVTFDAATGNILQQVAMN